MNPHDPFEDDLRTRLGAEAREPAPERLVARVTQIPNREPAGGGFLARLGLAVPRLGPGFAAVLGVVVIGLAVIVLRPLVDQSLNGPGSSATPSPGSSAVAVVPSFASDSPSPSEVPSTTVPATPVPSNLILTPTPTPRAPVAADFQAVSVTFVSPNDGWVLGSAGCTGATCPAKIARTTDGGRTWGAAGAPGATVRHDDGTDMFQTVGVTHLRFATTNDGWAFGPDLWATHDGGASWTKLTVSGLPAHAVVVALETARGVVHAVYYDGSQDFRIATSPIGSDGFVVSPLRVAVGAGPVPQIQLILSADSGWVLENDRTVTGGARLVNGTWESWAPACADVTGPAYLAASSAKDVIAVCDVGVWSTPQGTSLFVSKDGGSTFSKTGTKLPVSGSTSAATPDTSTIVAAGTDAQGSVLVGSFDGGKTWSNMLHTTGTLDELGFTTPTQGVSVGTTSAGKGTLYMTRDGGHTWAAVAL